MENRRTFDEIDQELTLIVHAASEYLPVRDAAIVRAIHTSFLLPHVRLATATTCRILAGK